MQSRRLLGVSATIATALLLAGCATPASDSAASMTDASVSAKATSFPVALAFSKTAEYAGNWVADAKGLYSKAGLDTNFLAGGPNSPAPEVEIASGAAVMGIEDNAPRLFSYLAKSKNIVIIGQVEQTAPQGLLSLSAHPVTDTKQLKGSKILAAAGNLAVPALMKVNGVKDYTMVPSGTDVGPLLAGQGDALLAFATNQPLTLEQQGMKEGKNFFFTPYSKFNYNVLGDTFIVSKSYLKTHRAAVVAFMAATIQGWNEAMKHPAEGAKLAVDTYGAGLGLNLAQQTALVKAQSTYMTSGLTKKQGLFAISPSYVQKKVYPSLRATGVTNIPAASSVINTSVLKDAQKSLKKK